MSEATPSRVVIRPIDLDSAEQVGVAPTDGRISLDGSLIDVPAYAPYRQAGLLITQPLDAGGPVAATRSAVDALVPDDGAIEVDVRGSVDGVSWTTWYSAGDAVFPWPVRFLQHRLTLLGEWTSPSVAGLTSAIQMTEASMSALQGGSRPTVRVFGSREGLTGRQTANGHTITADDRFAALPSRRVLNAPGKSDYRVRVTYLDRSVELPIWDVGPWNSKDNYWDENRESFRDLPRFIPQAFAAWADNYNGGKDGSGRWVSFPSSIDISDAAFSDDLKLKTSAWVDVTFLWLDAPSPPAGPTPPVLGLKPLDSKGMQSGTGTSGPAASARSAAQPAASVAARPSVASAPAPKAMPFAQYFPYVPVDSGIDSWIVLQNLNDQPTGAELQFSRVDGQRETRAVTVPPGARYSVSAGQLVGAGEYSVEVDSERRLAAERSIFLSADAMNVSGVVTPSRTWFFPEGSTEPPMETVIALVNPGAHDALATMTFLGDKGKIRTTDIRLARGARALVNLGEMIPAGGVSTILDADQPLIAERLTFTANRTGGDGTIGSVAASASWSFADANTTPGMDSWLILLNPTDIEANVQARLFNDAGPMGERSYTVPARSRSPIRLTDETPDARFGMVLNADQPIVAERSEFLNDGANPVSIISVLGATDPAPTWTFPEGASASAQAESVALLNAGDAPATVRFELTGDKGRVTSREAKVPPRSTFVFDVPRDAAESTMSTRVIADRPVTVERQIRLGGGRGATGSAGIRL